MEKFDKGTNMSFESSFSVLISKKGEEGGMIYECDSTSGYIRIANVVNLKNE